MSRLAVALFVLSLAAPPAALARCGPSRLSGGITKPQIIKLNALERGVRDAPAFYMQLPQSWVLLYFKPEDVVAQLKQTAAQYRSKDLTAATSATDEYLAAISRDLPLKEDTDLFKYVLQDNHFHSRQEFLVADLLKLGQAHIDDWPYRDARHDPNDDRDDRNTLVMVSKMLSDEEWRLFCEPLGLDGNPDRTRELFSVTYVIY
ncbi:MAG TPA: hypothetical protein VGO61_16745 [Steroidobacteraceae bacterium]|jgi:hypothetical protein|nr:hypothetical protein [Steroidobacteraceae bacterium]